MQLKPDLTLPPPSRRILADTRDGSAKGKYINLGIEYWPILDAIRAKHSLNDRQVFEICLSLLAIGVGVRVEKARRLLYNRLIGFAVREQIQSALTSAIAKSKNKK